MRGMNRSSGVTAIAIFALLGSLLCVGMACVMGLTFFFAPTKAIDPAAQPLAKVSLVVAVIFFLVPAIWGIASSIGLFRLRRWARVSTLIFAGLLIFFGLASPLFILAIPMPPPPNVDPAVMTDIKIGITGFYLSLAAIGAWWMIYLTRPTVKTQFQAGGVPASPPRRPLSISIIAWFLIVTSCCLPLNMALRFPAVLFGAVITGWSANLYLLLFCAAAIISAIGLLRLKPYGRLLSIAYFVFGMVNATVTWLIPGSAERVVRMFDAMPAYFRTQPRPTFNPVLMAVVTIPWMLLPLYFLMKHKPAFDPKGPSPETPLPPLAQGAGS
jgi:hypothetical protein